MIATPAEYRFFSYFRRIAELLTEPFDEVAHAGVTEFFFGADQRFGPVPPRCSPIDAEIAST
jgi:hypothetical protein